MKLNIDFGKDERKNENKQEQNDVTSIRLNDNKKKKKSKAKGLAGLLSNAKRAIKMAKTIAMTAKLAQIIAIIAAIISVVTIIWSAIVDFYTRGSVPLQSYDEDPCIIDASTLYNSDALTVATEYINMTVAVLKAMGLNERQIAGACMNFMCEGALHITDADGNTFHAFTPYSRQNDNYTHTEPYDGLPSSSSVIGKTNEEIKELDGYGAGFGIAQWTSQGRRDGLMQLAIDNGAEWYDMDIQLIYLVQELNGSYLSAYKEATSSATTYEECVIAWADTYEGNAAGGESRWTDGVMADGGKYKDWMAAMVAQAYRNSQYTAFASSILSRAGTEVSVNAKTNCYVVYGLADAIVVQGANFSLPNDELGYGAHDPHGIRGTMSNIQSKQEYIDAVDRIDSELGTNLSDSDYTSCASFVSTAIYTAGVAKSFHPSAAVIDLQTEFEGNPSIWTEVTANIVNGSDTLKNGDILLIKDDNSSHVKIYASPETLYTLIEPRTVWIAGGGATMNSVGNVTISAESGVNIMQASIDRGNGGHQPSASQTSEDSLVSSLLGYGGSTSGYRVFRLRTGK